MKYITISQGVDEPQIEGFFSLSDTQKEIQAILGKEPSGLGTCITLYNEKPITNADLIANSALLGSNLDSFSIMIFGRNAYSINNRVESAGYFEKSNKRKYDPAEIDSITAVVFQGGDQWRSLFKLEKFELKVDHEAHAKILRATNGSQVTTEHESKGAIPYVSVVFVVLIIALAIALFRKLL